MRSLRKDKRKLYISKRLSSAPIFDDEGNQTGEYAKVYDKPIRLNLDVKPISNTLDMQMFGENADKMLKITYTLYDSNGFEIKNNFAVWLDVISNGILTDGDMHNPINNDYVVIKTINFGSQNVAYIKRIVGFKDEN